MIRFKVFKGSHLLLAISMIVLLAAIIFVSLYGNAANPADMQANTVSITESMVTDEAKAVTAFASLSNASPLLQIEIIPDEDTVRIENADQKRILIYHTHTHEAYEQTEAALYNAIEAWRTADSEHNVVHLGKMLANELRRLGHSVVHDTTDHELDSMDEAYIISLKTLESYQENFDLCIDLHRDAYHEGMNMFIKAGGGQEYAQFMCLVGRGDSYSGKEKPDYASNLDFAQKLTLALNAEIPGICRNVTVKTGRYNQHIGRNNLLIEVGHNRNTLQQAMNSIPCLAKGIHSTLISQ